MTAKYNILCLSKRTLRKVNCNFLKIISRQYASRGVNLWDNVLDTEMKFKIENYWRDKVAAVSGNRTNNIKEKFYVLSMFPYPSGSLHMGHVRVYTISDTIARYYRMNGKNVIHPIGWDAFGLPAENAAIEKNIKPAEWTEQNINYMREQLNTLACSFDWDREISTCKPNYYKWTQELFLKLYDKKLVYKKEAFVNWDPVDHTVLADEQISEEGTSWRSGAKVEKKLLNQWFVKTTAFAKSLLDGLEDPILKEWKDIIKIQNWWIGECNGTNFDFKLISSNSEYPKIITVWTDKPEYIEDVKFVAVSKNSILNKNIHSITEHVQITKIDDVKMINSFTKTEIPIFVTDEIEFPVGRNEYLGIPCASEKDAELCRKIGIEFEVNETLSTNEKEQKRIKILEQAQKDNIGGYLVSSHLGDWLISRQRYWGTPIPIIHCEKCGIQPVPRDQLPVVLPELKDASSKGKSLIHSHEWLNVECPSCGRPAMREADTMDTFVDSTWYFIRYLDSKNEKEMFNKEKVQHLLPVDLYIGGKEHACLHLYFARFVNHFLYSLGLVPTREPFKQLLVLGMVMGMAYKVQNTGKYLKESEIDKIEGKYYERSTGLPVIADWDKMSKSKYNGVDPIEMFSKYSVDTVRLLIMCDAAPTTQRNWSIDSFDNILNWQKRVWLLVQSFLQNRHKLKEEGFQIDQSIVDKEDAEMFEQRNFHLKGVCNNIVGTQQLSVAISKMQSLTKRLRRVSAVGMAKSREFERALATQIIMLAPLAPHFASELWAGFCSAPHRLVNSEEIKWDKDVLEQEWPEVDMDYKLNLIIFVNNSEIITIKVPRRTLIHSTLDEITQLAENQPKVRKYIRGWQIVDVKYHAQIGLDGTLKFVTKKIDKIFQETTG